MPKLRMDTAVVLVSDGEEVVSTGKTNMEESAPTARQVEENQLVVPAAHLDNADPRNAGAHLVNAQPREITMS